jgi:hypothetical protein
MCRSQQFGSRAIRSWLPEAGCEGLDAGASPGNTWFRVGGRRALGMSTEGRIEIPLVVSCTLVRESFTVRGSLTGERHGPEPPACAERMVRCSGDHSRLCPIRG